MSEAFTGLRLYNTLTRKKEDFVPLDPGNVRMYVCGPTVYDYAHIGNARPAIVFDVLFRLLRHVYGADRVTYVRNITDVDDKINARALRDHGGAIASGKLSLNEAIRKVTEPTYEQYQKDVTALGCLPPTHQPRATEHIDGMIAMAQQLLDRGHAYLAQGGEGSEVLFDVASMPAYGRLSNRRLEDQQAGARIEVKDHKKNPGDFVLWKESSGSEPGWPAHFHAAGGHVDIFGRPGWHLECSVMSEAYLGREFDIHGGGLDLIFPHHENEIAQSCCAHGTEVMANVWMHNGFLQVEGRKMSKSEGNFVTIHELLETETFGGRSWPGEVLRLAMLMTHYREPIDFSVRRLEEADQELRDWALRLSIILEHEGVVKDGHIVGDLEDRAPSERLLESLSDDLNFSMAIAHLRDQFKGLSIALKRSSANPEAREAAAQFLSDTRFVGVLDLKSAVIWAFGLHPDRQVWDDFRAELIELRTAALNGNEARSRQIVVSLEREGVSVTRKAPGVWRLFVGADSSSVLINEKITSRLALIAQKNWAEADKIRDELLAQGIQLKDGKDPATGERVTTWEVRR